ncbi:DUF6090 family protein [Aestuariibaculum sp. M13]|uniref:DUF6090 family protein n=1 Tax=Aestuariibaculum sp. M13 TaxID=2967132 RepID=UPI002159D6F4|nr:DUF6090 family protein [Aestuariibaculum sp. M13]MCR8667694.1 DUF6090 family protein [Aestuariibaculum sp. M13]
MIKFFRKIRQNSIKENKTINYLKYAFGETILVVLGILIALQVNEWNNERNRKNIESTILKQLETDLKTSETELKKISAFYLDRARASALVERAFWKEEIPNDTIEKSIRIPMSSRIYSPVLGTLRSLINSGNMDNISSDSIKNELTSYLEKVDYLLKDIRRYEETYYRKGVEKVNQNFPNTFTSLEEHKNYYSENLEKVTQRKNYELGLYLIPPDLDKVPFQSNLEEFFNNKELFIAYKSLYIAHRNVYYRYNDILDLTSGLLVKIEKEIKP